MTDQNAGEYEIQGEPEQVFDMQVEDDLNMDDQDNGSGSDEDDSFVPKSEFQKLEQQYKSLQGQFRESNPKAMQAQIQFLQDLVLKSQQQQAPVKAEPEPEYPRLSENMRSLLGPQADEFESMVTGPLRMVSEQQKQISQLTAALQQLGGQVAKTPYDVMRATDEVYSSQDFSDFLESEKDALGDSLADAIKLRGGQGTDQGMKALAGAKRLFLLKKQSEVQKPQPQGRQSMIPNFNNPAPKSNPQQPTSRKVQELLSEFKKLPQDRLNSSDLNRKLQILGQLGVAGYDVSQLSN